MNIKNKISTMAIIATFGISSFIGYNSMKPTNPNYEDKGRTNINLQMEHIENIAKEPHSVMNPEAKNKVKEYIVSELNKLDVDIKTYKYENIKENINNTEVDIENIYGEIKGEEESYIMLVTHYDSADAKKGRYSQSEGSLGAADAGYGVSTILETLRVIKENNPQMKNGIKVLFTDAEEYGMLGAKEAVKNDEIFKDVNFLINLEARGTDGPAIMFETSPNNTAVMDLYEKTNTPFTYSITPEIYRVLPNYTDFTEFLAKGITGINISVLDGFENYHTKNDSPEFVNKQSMQHYGDQVVPIVEEFVTNEKYSNPESLKSNSDSIFFNFGSKLIRYSKTFNIALLLVIVIGLIFICNKLKLKLSKNILKYTLINTIYTGLAMVVGFGISNLLAIINGRKFELTYLPLIKFEGLIFISVMIGLFVGYYYLMKKVSKNYEELNELTIGSIISLLLVSIVFTIALPGASYLTVIPALLITLSLVIQNVLKDKKCINYIMLIPIAFLGILYVPTIYLFNCALTIGALCANIMFAMFAYTGLLISILNTRKKSI